MNMRLRAAGAFVLLAGFFAVGLVLIAVMAAADRFLLTHLASGYGAGFEGALITATVVVAVGIVRGMYAFLRSGRLAPAPRALPVTAREQPELWAEITAAAEAVGERAPHEVYLTAEVEAAVSEHSRLLGLLPGRRRMLLGTPLLTAVTVPHLRAVLAHEFGHFSNGDTRLQGPLVRGRTAMAHTVDVFSGDLTWFDRGVAALYLGYARMYLRRTTTLAREQELAADRAAARYAGRDTAAAALRAVRTVEAAWAHYVETYATLGAPFGALPPAGEVHGGFRRLLAARPGERLAALGEGRRPYRPHKYDAHPSDAERLARLGHLPADARTETAGAPAALTLLRDPDAVFTALEAAALPAETAGHARRSWDELTLARAAADAEEWSRPLRVATARAQRTDRGAPLPEADELPGLEAVLDAFDRGLLWMEIANRLPKPASAGHLPDEAARNFVRPAVFDGLAGMVHLRLLAAGQATPDIAWATRPGIGLPAVWEREMDAALDAATADTPDTAPLRALLAGASPVPA